MGKEEIQTEGRSLGRLMEKGSCTVMAFYPTRAVHFRFQFTSRGYRKPLEYGATDRPENACLRPCKAQASMFRMSAGV